MTITLHHGDIPADLSFGSVVAVDAEMMGLNPRRDRLCLVQLSNGDGSAHLVKFDGQNYNAPNLKKLLADKNIVKIFHYARLDLVFFLTYLGVETAPVYCTKIASKIARTFTPYHGYKNVCRDLLGLDIDKQQQTTNWGAETLSPEQLEYAAADVYHLHKLKDALDDILKREGRLHLAQHCFDFLPHLAKIDQAGWQDENIFEH